MLRTLAPWAMYLGIAIAMAAGAAWPRPMWLGVLAGLVVIGAGITMKRFAGAPPLDAAGHEPGEPAPSERREGGKRPASLGDALAGVARDLATLVSEAPALDVETVKQRVESLISRGPERVGAAQEAITARVGFAAYAEVMAPLAMTERLLYRAWSAASDSHRPECQRSLAEAAPIAEEAAEIAARALKGV